MSGRAEPLVLGFGGLAADQLCLVDRLPVSDSVQYIRAHTREAGGMIGTALAAVARLGGRAACAGVVGDDEAGRSLLAALRALGIDTGRLIVDPTAATPFSVVLVEEGSGSRSIVHFRGVRDRDRVDLGGAAPEDLLAGAALLHVDASWIETAIGLARTARRRGIPVCMDAGQRQRDPRIWRLIETADYVVVPEELALALSGRSTVESAADRLLEQARATGAGRAVVVTRGGQGSYTVAAGGSSFHTPAFRVAVVDTTGAGDSFHGGLLYALGHAFGLREAVRFATAVAALNCTRLGGQSGLPTLPEVERMLAGG